MSADPSAIHHHHPAVVAAPSTTRPASSSVIFRSALYNNIATVADDNPLHEPLPILTPPSTPAQLDRSSLQPVHLLLPSALTRGTGSSVSTAVITLRDGTPAASTEAAGDGMRRRMATGGRVVEKTVITQTTVVTRAKSRIDEEEEEEAGDDEVGSRQDSGACSAQSSASKGSSFRPDAASQARQQSSPPSPRALSNPPPSSSSSSSSGSSSSSASVPSPTPAAAAASSSPHVPTRVHPSSIMPSVPFHRKLQPSILSSDAAPSNFRGLYNLAGITLFTLTTRLVLENLSKYGLIARLNVLHWLTQDWRSTWPCLVVGVALCCLSPVVAWAVERAAAERKLSSTAAAILHSVHALGVFIVPQLCTLWSSASVLSGLLLVLLDFVFSMKLVSYAHVCHDIRSRILNTQQRLQTAEQERPPSPVSSEFDVASLHPTLPDSYCPSLSHTFYFFAAPTLIYQLSYPRSPTIRLPFLLRRCTELVFCLTLQLLLIEQYVYPAVRNGMASLHSLDYLAITERILKIALPNGCCWLLMFYGLFHSTLNISGELLRFGDRLFYRDWWNCQDLNVYWSSWNLPVHHWVMRHLYAPAIRSGLSPTVAQLLSFLVSAVLHELLVAVPLHTLQLYAFWGMVAQVPLIWFTKWMVRRLKQPVWSNCVFWLTFLVFGQPLLILLYSHAVLSKTPLSAEPGEVIIPQPAVL